MAHVPDENINNTRLCPNVTQFELFKVAGSIQDKINRTSVSLSIKQCDPNHYKCKSEEEVNKFLSFFYFEQHAIQTRIDFSKSIAEASKTVEIGLSDLTSIAGVHNEEK